MVNRWKRSRHCAALSLCAFLGFASCGTVLEKSSGTTEPGFARIFDGETFRGWKAADMSFWSIEDGAITAKITEEHPTKRNHYLVYQGGKLGDFELKLRHRILRSHDVNCGF